MTTPNRHDALAQLDGTPRRDFYAGGDIDRVEAVADLRARTHALMPRLVLEYLEGGADDEATLARERAAYAAWRFVPRQLVDVSERSLAAPILGHTAPMPLVVAPTGLNGLFMRGGDMALAQGAAEVGVPFTQSTMSNEPMEEVATVAGLRHWWQLYVFGGEEIWQELLRRADACGVEALVLTTNAQIYGNREWEARTRVSQSVPTPAAAFDAALHPRWAASTLAHGMPTFANVAGFLPKDKRGFFESADWIREQMPKSLSWGTVAKIRDRWKKPFLLKGLMHPADVARARDCGVDGVVLGTHGGRQADWSVAALDVLTQAKRVAGDMPVMMSGGIRRGSDLLKALALGADAVLAGRAPLYGLCAFGAAGVAKALSLIHDEAINDMGQLGAVRAADVAPLMCRADALPLGEANPIA